MPPASEDEITVRAAFTFDVYGHLTRKAGTAAASAVAAIVDSVTNL